MTDIDNRMRLIIDCDRQSTEIGNQLRSAINGDRQSTEILTELKEKEIQIQDLSKKLKLSINNAKKMEAEVLLQVIYITLLKILFQFSQIEEKLSHCDEEKKRIESQNKKLSKQLDKAKEDLDQYSLEAEKASKNPWESDEWEGLTAAEMYEMMKHELVPAQQAR